MQHCAGGPGTYLFAPGWALRNVDNLNPATSVAFVSEAWEIREDFDEAPAGLSNCVAFQQRLLHAGRHCQRLHVEPGHGDPGAGCDLALARQVV